MRVKNAIIQKSNLTAHDIKDEIIKKYQGFVATVENAGSMIHVFKYHVIKKP